MNMRKLVYSILLAGVLAFGSAGCTTTSSASGDLAVQISFKYALAKRIEKSDNPAAKAANIRKALDDTRAWYKVNEQANLSKLKAVLLSRIESTADKIAADALLTSYVIPSLEQVVKDGVKVPAGAEDLVVNVNKFIDWAYEAASLY